MLKDEGTNSRQVDRPFVSVIFSMHESSSDGPSDGPSGPTDSRRLVERPDAEQPQVGGFASFRCRGGEQLMPLLQETWMGAPVSWGGV